MSIFDYFRPLQSGPEEEVREFVEEVKRSIDREEPYEGRIEKSDIASLSNRLDADEVNFDEATLADWYVRSKEDASLFSDTPFEREGGLAALYQKVQDAAVVMDMGEEYKVKIDWGAGYSI